MELPRDDGQDGCRRLIRARVYNFDGPAQACRKLTLFLVSGLDNDLNPRRIERYLVLALESGAEPVLVLNKADLCQDLGAAIGAARSVAAGHPVVVANALDGTGVEAMREWLRPGVTASLLGSSGVGKSTLLNTLLGVERQPTAGVREHDSRGRHTTTHRELFPIPGGGLLLDQPGLREIQPWAEAASVEAAFPEVAEHAVNCRFRDCRHQGEPGCAVVGAVDEARLASYDKLSRERDALAIKRRDRQGSLWVRQFQKLHDKRR